MELRVQHRNLNHWVTGCTGLWNKLTTKIGGFFIGLRSTYGFTLLHLLIRSWFSLKSFVDLTNEQTNSSTNTTSLIIMYIILTQKSYRMYGSEQWTSCASLQDLWFYTGGWSSEIFRNLIAETDAAVDSALERHRHKRPTHPHSSCPAWHFS